jgi:hypothetical protein
MSALPPITEVGRRGQVSICLSVYGPNQDSCSVSSRVAGNGGGIEEIFHRRPNGTGGTPRERVSLSFGKKTTSKTNILEGLEHGLTRAGRSPAIKAGTVRLSLPRQRGRWSHAARTVHLAAQMLGEQAAHGGRSCRRPQGRNCRHAQTGRAAARSRARGPNEGKGMTEVLPQIRRLVPVCARAASRAHTYAWGRCCSGSTTPLDGRDHSLSPPIGYAAEGEHDVEHLKVFGLQGLPHVCAHRVRLPRHGAR